MLVSIPPLSENYDDRIHLKRGLKKVFLGSIDIGFNFKKGSIYFFCVLNKINITDLVYPFQSTPI